MSEVARAEELERTLHERFGLERFRPGQREVIERVLEGRDVLCVMPTGGGKSLCYQLPALLLEGLTLVVSPLIALMKDQVDALSQRGIRATLLNSTLDPAEQLARLVEIEQRKFDLVYVAPERFQSTRFVEAMHRVKPALLAVDEAHCISEWGHDFRPDYARIGHARKRLGSPPCIALTATATDIVRRDIADQLDLSDPAQFVTGFDRPNLVYRVVEARRDHQKLAALAKVLDENSGSAIVYASSRARCESIGQFLESERRKSAVIYHAGMGREERTAAQDKFMSGKAEVVVATNAFGMGVDKPDIRAVVHFNLPGTIEAYYQEAGRAGRDGLPAECVLLYTPSDRFLQELFIENEYPPPDMVYRVYEFLRSIESDPIELTQAEIREAAHVDQPEGAVGSALRILETAGAIERFRPRENMAIVRINAEPDAPSFVDRLGPQAHIQRTVLLGLEGLVNRRYGEAVYFQPDAFAAALGLDRTALTRALRNLIEELPIDYVPPFRGNAIRVLDRSQRARDIKIDFAPLRKRKNQEYEKLDRMTRYAETEKCRRSYILSYFGEADPSHCGRCDNCGTGTELRPEPAGGAIDTPAGREVILKILSGVARTKGKFGKTTIAQMLTGSGSEKIVRWGLANLSTFGILTGSGFAQQELVQVMDALSTAGLIENQDVDRFRPAVSLSTEGWAYLRSKGETELILPLPPELLERVRLGGLRRLAPRTPVVSEDSDSSDQLSLEMVGPSETRTVEAVAADDPLRERLKNLRWELAKEAKQPAYCIFTNETLEQLVQQRPRTPHGLAAIKGLGPSRLERYGAALLEAIAGTREPARVADPSQPSNGLAPALVSCPPLPTEEWTGRLLDRGFSAAEAAEIRGLDLSAIIRHAALLVSQGRTVPIEAFLPTDVLEDWQGWLDQQGPDSPPDDSSISAKLWPLFVACRRSED